MTLLLVTYDHPTLATQTWGEDQPWEIDDEPGGIGGIDDVDARLLDTGRDYGPGDVAGPHYENALIVTVPLRLGENVTPGEAIALVNDLRPVWVPFEDTTSFVTMTVERWGDVRELVGRPISLKVKTNLLRSGDASAFGKFKVYSETPGS